MATFKNVLQPFAATLIIVVALMVAACNAKLGEPRVGTKEEYKVLALQAGGPGAEARLEEILNNYAKEGWKVRTGGWGNGFSFIILARQ